MRWSFYLLGKSSCELESNPAASLLLKMSILSWSSGGIGVTDGTEGLFRTRDWRLGPPLMAGFGPGPVGEGTRAIGGMGRAKANPLLTPSRLKQEIHSRPNPAKLD